MINIPNVKSAKCPVCNVNIVDGAIFCHMCGIRLEEAQAEREVRMRAGEIPLYRYSFQTMGTEKTIEVWNHDIVTFPLHFDLLTISAYQNSYSIFSRSVIGSLWEKWGIDAGKLSQKPYMDLRSSTGCWLSCEIPPDQSSSHFSRIGCIEMKSRRGQDNSIVENRIQCYFHLLDLASCAGVPMETVAIPIIGTGIQKRQIDQMLIPLVNEIVSLLRRNRIVKKIALIDRNWEKVEMAVAAFRRSYQIAYSDKEKERDIGKEKKGKFIFISYTTHGDTNAAELIRDRLKARGINCWYAPDDIHTGDYASQIVEAIRRCTHFICLISKNTASSVHVLNELDLAFNRLNEGISILPFLLDNTQMNDTFSYYLSRIQWSYGYPLPLADRVEEFLNKVFPDQADNPSAYSKAAR